MKKRLTRIAPLKLGLAMAVGFVLVGLVLGMLSRLMNSDSDYSYDQINLTPVVPAGTTVKASVPLGTPATEVGGHGDRVWIYGGSTVMHANFTASFDGEPPTFSFWVMMLFLVAYGAVGFLSGVSVALIFNLTARFTGGVVINVEDIPADSR